MMILPYFILIYGDSPMIPFILVITLHDKKTCFYVFLTFRNLNKIKLNWNSGVVNISAREASGELEFYEMGHECQNIPGGVPSQGGTPPRNFPSSTV
jgi:hypothetical protein